jgi:hypothetical protein
MSFEIAADLLNEISPEYRDYVSRRFEDDFASIFKREWNDDENSVCTKNRGRDIGERMQRAETPGDGPNIYDVPNADACRGYSDS